VEEDATTSAAASSPDTVIDPFGNAFGVIVNPHFERRR